MSVLKNIKKQASKITDVSEVSDQLSKLENIIQDADNSIKDEVKKLQEKAVESFNVEISIIKSKSNFVDTMIDGIDQQAKNKIEESLNSAKEKLDTGFEEVTKKVELKIDENVSLIEKKTKEAADGFISKVEKESQEKLEIIYKKAEEAAKKKFEKEMGLGVVNFIISRIKSYLK